jgi:hypothetical protein
MLHRLKFRLSELVNIMLDKLPAEVWTSSTTTFLDPSIGGGQFVQEIEKRLLDAGHTTENIKNRVYGFESSTLRIRSVVGKHKLKGIYKKSEFVNEEINMKFDIVATNPPFQDEDKNPLYYKFYNKIVTDALKPNGYLAIIAPKPLPVALESGIIKGKHRVEQREILYVNMSTEIEKHFNVGSTFSFTVLKNAPKKNKDYDIVTADGKTIKGRVSAFSMFSNPIVNSILDKCFKFNSNPYKGVWNTAGKGAIKDENGTSTVAIRLHNGNKFETYNVRWDRPHKLQGVPKVFVTAFGNRAAVCYDHDLVCATEKLLYTIPTASDTESERLLSVIESNLQKFLYKFVFKRGERVAFLNHFKGVPLTQDWTNKKLYAHFDLTDEEISYIEENI